MAQRLTPAQAELEASELRRLKDTDTSEELFFVMAMSGVGGISAATPRLQQAHKKPNCNIVFIHIGRILISILLQGSSLAP